MIMFGPTYATGRAPQQKRHPLGGRQAKAFRLLVHELVSGSWHPLGSRSEAA
jgi:hypothetical protein